MVDVFHEELEDKRAEAATNWVLIDDRLGQKSTDQLEPVLARAHLGQCALVRLKEVSVQHTVPE
jgi:hypothetical protein